MIMEIGAVAIALVVLLITFLLFGRDVENSFKAKFLYWLKSTMKMAPSLSAWFAYNDQVAFGLMGTVVSIGLAAVLTLGRSYLLAML
ncbi:hypothetical protein BX592_1463 [Paraburkholderia rhizosphaerae]|uniref:Uncharacterized protein n=2 Tax=Paraburkholderia rhizosphaerae TaxID=480658 RepID=A0A4V6QCU4_9BURK|nr:hypothetical protein BX592_1463 [Paraburkholderia rhizosphaerae]